MAKFKCSEHGPESYDEHRVRHPRHALLDGGYDYSPLLDTATTCPYCGRTFTSERERDAHVPCPERKGDG
jgi:hypothetical protein